MVYILLLVGLILLCGGGEFLVRGSVGVAKRLGISQLLIGLTLVGFGTSSPELVASVKAALAGAPGIAVGNVVGSNISNILLIVGSTAVIMPILCSRFALKRDGTVMLVATVIFGFVCYAGFITRWMGLGLFLALVFYLAFCYFQERRSTAAARLHEAEAAEIEPLPGSLTRNLLVALGGLIAVLIGASLLVDSAIQLARLAGVSETLIGLTVVAIGTSLPELVASVIAALKRHADVAFGNILGSNLFNLFGIMGVTALVRPIPVPHEILGLDYWVLLGASLLLIGAATVGLRIRRWQGVVFVALYATYLSYLYSTAVAPAAPAL
ncbi:calcium/sodium antiporter [Fodinicurvata halophila]|uniref:Calcium/sodium antiporter n=1 Tax=Fodinicurvata halophila TaxID=1419723 RepID=A0ABV8UMN7_9PROT